MDKQRLLELAGVTEAKYAGGGQTWVVVTYDDGQFNVIGPFHKEDEAERYVRWEVEEFELEEEHFGQVVEVYGPEW